MENITTKQLFDKFFEGRDESAIKKIRPQVDRQEVYEFEQKIGKQLVDMNVDELFEMILTFNGNRNCSQANYSIGYSSYTQIASTYRQVFNYYIDNVKVIKNPFNNKRMKGTEAAKRLAQDKEPFTKEFVQDLIIKLRQDNNEDRADYIECIMLMFYCGFAEAQEIVMLKENMIDFKSKSVRLSGRTIQLSDRCFELLEKIHNSENMTGWRGELVMDSWHGSYFKFSVRPKSAEKLQDRPLTEMANIINREIITHVKSYYGVDINYRLLYLLGFYEHIKKMYGEKRADELITAVRDTEATKDLLNAARIYGVVVDNVTVLKKSLRPFLKSE